MVVGNYFLYTFVGLAPPNLCIFVVFPALLNLTASYGPKICINLAFPYVLLRTGSSIFWPFRLPMLIWTEYVCPFQGLLVLVTPRVDC